MDIAATSPTLIDRLKDPDDGSAWNRFYCLYSPLIISYARRKNCAEDMALDVLQETMVCLMRKIPDFHYDPRTGRFRGYLYTIVHRRIMDAFRRNKGVQQIDSKRDNTDPVAEFADSKIVDPCNDWDEQWDRNLMHRAMELLKEKVNPWSYACFTLNALHGLDVDVVIQKINSEHKMNIKAEHVYTNKNRLTKLLKEEIGKLKEELGD